MKSDRSRDDPPNLSKGVSGSHEQERPDSPVDSNVSMKSDRSRDDPPNLSKGVSGSHEQERPDSPVDSNVSMKSDRSRDDPPNLSKGVSGPPVSQTQVSSASMKTDQFEDDPLNFSKELEEDAKHKFTADQKKRILEDYKEELSQHDTELYETVKKKERNHKLVQTYNDIFHSKKNKVRTVLMKGEAGVGKTFQTRLFMVDWANGKSNKNIDLIVRLNFSELRDEVQSMEDLLHFFTSIEQPVVYSYDECEIVFVLDGLEKCELPLDFDKNEDLSDMKEQASMDVLLTNLIKGNLLPSARLWIISQPSGVDKIPMKYIHKVTECQGFLTLTEEKHKLLVEYNSYQGMGQGRLRPGCAEQLQAGRM
ncbi:NACHT, LRR and PYD domains-containing protein 5-like [Thunnus thynnus]|uniref:NACHT, LRR and PYD domains-containing protein 5-like n=1 Tax=Thunnus thynnus TaxID=8237 RepID=UPI003529C859